MAAELRLPALALPGLSPDSLGNYLASLGLLHVLSRKWAAARIAWRDEVLHVIGGPTTLDDLLDELVRIAGEREWTPYVRSWNDARLRSAKEGGHPLAQWSALADESVLELFGAHIVPHGDKRSINPVLGKLAGAIGRRDFAAGWKQATDALVNGAKKSTGRTKKKDVPEFNSSVDDRKGELKALLAGDGVTWQLEKLNAATWFSQANKLYNSGQKAFREGLLSPWLMVFACEGLGFLSGGTSRRLGAHARTTGAFPFVTRHAAATSSQAADRDAAEFWAPLWSRPMTSVEIGVLFRRGRAEVFGQSASAPARFAAAIRQRGVDAGIQEFHRFVLGWTTAHDYTEARFGGAIAVAAPAKGTAPDATSDVLRQISAVIEQRGFPQDSKRFVGLRGPIEAALLNVAAEPNRSEAAVALLDAVAVALDRIDRNRSFREGKVRWEPLPLKWLLSVFADERPGVEARLALSLVSAFPVVRPFATYRFGVEWNFGRYEHTERPPARWVWRPGELARVLGAVLSRRLLDQATADASNGPHVGGCAPLPATTAFVQQWLTGDLDEVLLQAWLSRLALFDWMAVVPQELRSLVNAENTSARADGALALVGLVQPLIDQRSLVVRSLSQDDLLADETGARTTEAARSLVTLVRSGNLDSAVRLASSRYAMAGARLASVDVPWRAHESDRLVAALLFTIPDRDRAILFQRWLRPRRRQSGVEAHV